MIAVSGSGRTCPSHCCLMWGTHRLNQRRGAGRWRTLAAAAFVMQPPCGVRRAPPPVAAPGLRWRASESGPVIAAPKSLLTALASRAHIVEPSSSSSFASAGHRTASRRSAVESHRCIARAVCSASWFTSLPDRGFRLRHVLRTTAASALSTWRVRRIASDGDTPSSCSLRSLC